MLTWFTRAVVIARWISLENRSSPNPSRARARCHGRARHILAHTLPQTLSRCDLSLPSSRRHIDPAAIAWSQPRRACATPNMPVPSPCSSLDRASFCIMIFGVRFQWLGGPKVPLTHLVYTRRGYCTVGLAVRAARCQHGRESLRRFWIRPVPFCLGSDFQRGTKWRGRGRFVLDEFDDSRCHAYGS